MYLHFQKNNRTFEVHKSLGQSNQIFLNLNKAQAPGESPAYSSVLRRFVQRPEPILKLKKMHKPKTTTFKALSRETFTQEKVCTENGLRICKTSSDSQSLETFITFVPFTRISIETVAAIFEIAMESPDPAVFKKTFYTLAKQNQKLQQANTNN